MLRSLTTRLTVLYTLLFALLALFAFGVISYTLRQTLLDKIDNEFLDDGRELSEIYTQGGVDAIHQEILIEEKAEGGDKMFIRLYSPALVLIDSSNTEHWPSLPQQPKILAHLTRPTFTTLEITQNGDRARIFYQPLDDGHILQMGKRLTDNEQLLSRFQQTFAIAFSVMIFSGVVVGFYLSRKTLAGIQHVRETADQISRGNLSNKITFDTKTVEINDLIHSINRMQSKIGGLINELQAVTNNIAHDLRSPVTRIRGMAEITLVGEQSLDDYRNMSGAIIEECDSLVGMINTMLEIAETDARVKPLVLESVDITEMIRDVAELYSSVAEDKGIKISLQITEEPMIIAADRSRLQRVLANLLDNSLKFTPTGGWVSLAAKNTEESVEITIADSGIGIGEKDLPHVWERFYRADRSRSTPGTGLGLSLVQSIIHAHHGTVTLTSEVNAGTQISITFARSSCLPKNQPV